MTMQNNKTLKQITKEIANKINNEIEYKLDINEYFKIRNDEYYKLVDNGEILDTDDNFDDFDTYLGEFLNVNWG